MVLQRSFMIRLKPGGAKVAALRYIFSGIQTLPLISLIGYSLVLRSSSQMLPLTHGFAALAAFLCASDWHKLQSALAPSGCGLTGGIWNRANLPRSLL